MGQRIKFQSILLIGICALICADADAASYEHVSFDDTQRYSRLVIDARLGDFYANKNPMGFRTFDEDGAVVGGPADGSKVNMPIVIKVGRHRFKVSKPYSTKLRPAGAQDNEWQSAHLYDSARSKYFYSKIEEKQIILSSPTSNRSAQAMRACR
ncbi:MAG: hypothetical protein IKX59_00495 [Bacteroidales bacterium]|nr:hypothetical protein [Bacteroidales bacterium]